MATWFVHSASDIDAQREWKASKARDRMAWARLAARLVSAAIDPVSTEEDRVSGSSGLRFFQSRGEVVVYEIDHVGGLHVLAVGFAGKRADEGRLIAEATRRRKLR